MKYLLTLIISLFLLISRARFYFIFFFFSEIINFFDTAFEGNKFMNTVLTFRTGFNNRYFSPSFSFVDNRLRESWQKYEMNTIEPFFPPFPQIPIVHLINTIVLLKRSRISHSECGLTSFLSGIFSETLKGNKNFLLNTNPFSSLLFFFVHFLFFCLAS